MNKQAGMLRMKWCWALCLILSGVFCQGLMAEGVPGAMKYQAVLRDMEGNPMTNQEGLGIRITLRQGSPTGAILYQETHSDVKTDAFGLMQLEIGRGKVAEVGSETLLKVSWEDSPIYAQIEVENDGNGFTTMGASELLSVPYALFAGNAGGGLDLTDGFLPKYNGLSREFEDSKIKENPMEFIEFYPGNGSYSFPKTRGKEGEVLILMDDDGVLGWRSSSDSNKCMDCKDDYLTYWDKIDKVWRTSRMKYVDTKNTVTVESKFVTEDTVKITKGLDINTQVTGTHNLQYSELPEHHVWVGNPAQRSLPYKLGAGITLDSTSPDERVLNVNSGVSVWEYRGEGTTDYIHTKIDPSRQVKVGVGLSEPKTRFHVKDGSMLFSASNGTTDAVSDLDKGYHFYWSGEKGALRMGKFNQDASGLWRSANLGAGTIALGTDAEATQDDNVAIGAGAQATGIRSLAMGRNVQANSDTSVAIGNNVLVSGKNAIGIGNGSFSGSLGASTKFVASGANSVTIGNDIRNVKGDRSVSIGLSNEISANESVVIGSLLDVPGNDAGTSGITNIVIGKDIKVGSWNYMIQIGSALKMLTTANSSNAISIGSNHTLNKGAACINLGTALTIDNQKRTRKAINIGYSNNVTTKSDLEAYDEMGPVLLGQWLTNHNVDGGVVVGRFNAAATKVSGVNQAFVVGVGTKEADRKNALELYENGDLYLIGPVGAGARLYSNGYNITSDRRLKTDIESLNADFSVLKSLSPVRYRFIADQNQTLQFGFIAQDVERYFPHLVDTDSKGMKSLNYIGLLPVLWQYTQQLEKTVSDQAAEIERLRTETEALKADMKAIKAKLGL